MSIAFSAKIAALVCFNFKGSMWEYYGRRYRNYALIGEYNNQVIQNLYM
jgi:hypothetical protein